MSPENLVYALTQVVHNLGAVAVAGGAAFALWPLQRPEYARTFAWLLLGAWAAQIVSGGVFGLTSLYYYGELPDLSGIAMAALALKVLAALFGLLLAVVYLLRGRAWPLPHVKYTFQGLTALGAVALTAAAFLRWFS